MFSVIMPTMWRKPQITNYLLNLLINNSCVDEVIIIGNAFPTEEFVKNDKIKYFQQENNIYVNPSWNLGFKLAKNEKIILINDDILIPKNLFNTMDSIPLQDYGIIGISPESIYSSIDSYQEWDCHPNFVKIANEMNYGYGILMFVHKDNYYVIPEDMKVWFGDNYLFTNNLLAGKTNLTVTTLIKTEMSSTSNETQFDEIKVKDEENFLNHIKLKIKNNV